MVIKTHSYIPFKFTTQKTNQQIDRHYKDIQTTLE